MNPGRYFMPNMAPPTMGIRNAYMMSRGTNIFSKLFTNIKSINLEKILSGANKTLNVVNQTIPLIRQAGPMVNNAKSMLHLMKTFKKETNITTKRNVIYKPNSKHIINNSNNKIDNNISNNNDYPTFFI